MNQYPYLRKYARTDKAWQPSESSATVNRAFETIKTIRDGKEPSIPMLQAVLSLSARPDELPVLVDRSLIEECIRHLDQQRKGDSNYPFGCEQGYLYFRVIVLAVGVSAISRNKRTPEVIFSQMRKLQDPTTTLMAAMVEVTSVMNEDGAAAELDYTLGLSPGDSPIMGLSYAALLLRILWDDRKRFLVAWAYSDSPPLNGLFIVLWRFVRVLSTPDAWLHLCDIFGRHCLVAESHHIFALRQLTSDVTKRYGPWLPRETVVDLEDARNMLTIFAARMTPGSPLYRTPGPYVVPRMVQYALPMSELQLGTEDLFLPVLRVLFDYFWASKARGTHVSMSITVLMPVCAMLGHLVKYTLSASEFVNATAELGFIEALAQGVVLVSEDLEPGSKEDDSSDNGLAVFFQTYTSNLARLESSMYQEAYADLFVEWLKALRCLSLRDWMLGTHYQDNPSLIVRYWLGLGVLLEYSPQLAPAEAITRKCAYSRCPDPYQKDSDLFECPCEQGVLYCGLRCQRADWAADSLPTSHRHTCTWRKCQEVP